MVCMNIYFAIENEKKKRGKGSRYKEFFIFFYFYYLNLCSVGKQQPFLLSLFSF